MVESQVTRRLAAIVAIDVAGYSRLMGTDEAGTLARLKEHRAATDPIAEAHGGRLVGTAGDGLLFEFPSVVEAVTCTIEVQKVMAERNAGLPDDRKMLYRAGINLGDVLVDGDDIYGDGVNVAARLEALAEPGGICISRTVRDQIRDRLSVRLVDLGEIAVKNISRPVRAFRISVAAHDAPPAHEQNREQIKPASRPAIAVLPFVNIGGDPEQEYFADGITEDIITVLSKFRTFSVAARNSTFVYKGKAVDIKEFAAQLGARYVVEGSVRKAGGRIRITAQLIDAESGDHVWAERYDRQLVDVFHVQDEITECVVAAIAPEVMTAEVRRAQRKTSRDLDAWDAIMRARWHLMRFSAEDYAESMSLLSEACVHDPNNAVAWSDLAWCHLFAFSFGWSDSAPEALRLASQAAERAISLDRGDGRAWTAHGIVALFSDNHDDALESLRRSIQLNPNDPLAHGYLGLTLAFGGEATAALSHLEDAIRLSSRDPFTIIWFVGNTWSCFVEERFADALSWAEKARRENPRFPDVYTLLAAINSHLGDTEAAKAAATELMRIFPGLTLEDDRLWRPLRHDVNRARLVEGLRRAGIPE